MFSKISTLGVIKIIIFIFLIFSFFPTFAATSTNYWDYDESSTVSDNLNNFAPNTLVWTDKTTYDIEEDFKSQIWDIVTNISVALSIIAVLALVIAALKMTLSQWKDENIKKAKDIIKWTIIWYLALISAWAIIAILINFIYSI